MAAIRPVDLPDGTVTNSAVTIVDTGSTVVKATPQQIVDAARPLATQAEVEAGTNNTKMVTPLRVKQAIDARGTPDAAAVPFQQPTSGSVPSNVQASIRALGITPPDAATPAAALTQAIAQGVPSILAGSTVNAATALDGTSGNFQIRGAPGKTRLTATSAMPALIDVRNASEVSFSPFVVRDLSLNGAGQLTDAAVSVRYRRSYEVANLFAENAPVGAKLKDANSGILYNFRTSACAIGIHSVGSDHQVTYYSCAPIGASDVGLKLEAQGTELDGNYAQVAINPVIQSGTGRCIEVNYRTQLDLFGGYLGEAMNGVVIDNKGGSFTMRGGIAFFDYNPLDAAPTYQPTTGNYLVHPVGSGTTGQGGITRFQGTRIAAQATRGLSQLVYLAPGEVDLTKNGKVTFEDVDLYCLVAGGAVFNGDPIGAIGARRGLCARNGATWSAAASTGSAPTNFTSTVGGGFYPATARTVANTSTSPPPIIGLSTPLLSTDYRLDGPLFFIMCYQSTRPLVVRTGTAPLTGGGQTLASNVPATGAMSASGWKTFVALEATPNALASGVIEMFMTGAGASDAVSLLRAGLADADFINSGGKAGVLSNLYYP